MGAGGLDGGEKGSPAVGVGGNCQELSPCLSQAVTWIRPAELARLEDPGLCPGFP